MSLRHTTQRKKILDTLKAHRGVMSAKELHLMLPSIDLATIYRNLDLFTKEKLIKKVALGEGEATYEYQSEPHHHAICTDCEQVIHFSTSEETLKHALGLKDFEVEEIDVTVRGRHHRHGDKV